MKKNISKPKPNFFTEHKDLLIAGGTIVVLAGAGFTWYYLQKKKQPNSQRDIATITETPKSAIHSIKNVPSAVTRKSGYPLQYGSRHTDVKILQRYLKFYKEYLGTTGAKGDGVDGIFGPKTARAAKKRLGKSVFTQQDIEGMKRALKTMGK
ncbi:peptidoglycan-binding domain-containing protein [Aquimarina agarivorans]|uniref:peptidoglycan-binding domain-containing protein n=1 Tax=Aquimarina agarivorans TaxID=980584 RepID=UPI000248FC59|nr:peptidoglycan-binding domain-containing protein [Aquimarina agarivorans]